MTDKYYNATTQKGAPVWVSSAHKWQTRWVLTTRKDKAIRVRIGWHNYAPTWYAEID